MRHKLRVIFMGTPEFAVPSLKALIESQDDLVGVVTQPDRPKGRGRVLMLSPVKEKALKYGVELLQPERVREQGFIQRLNLLAPDLMVVVAYGHILPGSVLDIPPLGCINLHASLLPEYRGASPINWAIVNGEKETGVTTIFMDEGMDSGDILLSEKIAIQETDTYETLKNKLAFVGSDVLTKTINLLKEKKLKPIPQIPSKATYAPILKKEDGLIHWDKEAVRIKNLIRGMNPWPGTYTWWKGKRLKIVEGQVLEGKTGNVPGTVIKRSRDGIMVATGEGSFLITMLQPENKKTMRTEDFLMGYDLKEGDNLAL